jgi:hypothetical protein
VRVIDTAMPIYSINLTHYLDDMGLIAPQRGPARKMAEFLTAVVAHASDFDRPEEIPGPVCFRCHKRDQHIVDTGINEDWAIVWQCLACNSQGRISNWEGTFWDLSSAPEGN